DFLPYFTIHPATASPPFPYTTLFRSGEGRSTGRPARVTAHASPPGVLTETRVRPSGEATVTTWGCGAVRAARGRRKRVRRTAARSEEHTSELQSRRDLVCRLLLEKTH